ncbi:MAG TPA: hypothetical protein VGM18_00390 [Candidatus Sulfotelmatobacter sp.]
MSIWCYNLRPTMPANNLSHPKTVGALSPQVRCGLIVTVMLVRFAAAQAAQGDAIWTPFETQAGGFSISMPGAAAESQVTRPLRTVTVDLASKEGRLPSGEKFGCTVSVTFLPVSLESRDNAQHFIDSLLKGHVAVLESQKVSQTELLVQELPARRTEWARQDGNFKQSMLSVFTGNREFTVTFSSSLKNHAAFADRVFDSFHISDPRYVNPGEMIAFAPPGWNFSVKMPGFPELIQQANAAARSVSLSNYAFFVVVGELMHPPADANKFLEEKSASMGSPYHGKVVSNEAVPGVSARRLRIVGDKTATELMVGLRGTRWYAMSVGSKLGSEVDKNSTETFFASLVLN